MASVSSNISEIASGNNEVPTTASGNGQIPALVSGDNQTPMVMNGDGRMSRTMAESTIQDNSLAGSLDSEAQPLAVETAQRQLQQQQQQPPLLPFGTVRDRLFHAMIVRIAIGYNRNVPRTARRLFEFFILITAVSLLNILLFVHLSSYNNDGRCLSHLVGKWPRDGVLRIEVVNNLEKFNAYQGEALEKKQKNECNSTSYSLKRVLLEGTKALPKMQLDDEHYVVQKKKSDHWSNFLTTENALFNLFTKADTNTKKFTFNNLYFNQIDNSDEDDLIDQSEVSFEYVVEYSLHYGLLKLSHSYRLAHSIPFLLIRLDPEVDRCFGDLFSRSLMKYLVGYEDILMSSVKSLSENETDKGYLRDMITGEHYRFVTIGNAKTTYLTALIVMLIFTFAISMLLRFSHHQIFLFIVDLLQMFELNQALVFPVAPLLTVILALVGLEAIMSEVFNDTSTAFYVILLVWIADQYDAICCHSPICKRHWLRFFYLYHYAFYAYQYRYNGQYGGLALLTSTFFIIHSMIFFFHHYEMPLILYHERLQRIITDLQHNPPRQQGPAVGNDTQPATLMQRRVINETRVTARSAQDMGGLSGTNSTSSRPVLDTQYSAADGGRVSVIQFSTNTNESPYSVESRSSLYDPLRSAGERTARELVTSAMNGLL